MKKIFFSASAFMFFLVSCKDGATTATGNDNSQNEKNLASNLAVYKAIETGNMASVDSLFATDVVDHDGPHAADVNGKDSVLHMLADLHNHIKDLKLDVVSSAVNGDYIFSLVHITGTVADSAMGKPGEPIDQKGVDVIKLKDNKMAEHWGFTDDAQVSKEMMAMHNKMNAADSSKMKK
jgi:predicted SnoaL-like aldol condensation-catalyzing enzyme